MRILMREGGKRLAKGAGDPKRARQVKQAMKVGRRINRL